MAEKAFWVDFGTKTVLTAEGHVTAIYGQTDRRGVEESPVLWTLDSYTALIRWRDGVILTAHKLVLNIHCKQITRPMTKYPSQVDRVFRHLP